MNRNILADEEKQKLKRERGRATKVLEINAVEVKEVRGVRVVKAVPRPHPLQGKRGLMYMDIILGPGKQLCQSHVTI